jgi:hypothetical protein
MRAILNILPEDLRIKILFRIGLVSIPMMGYVRPRLIELSQDKVVVRVNVSRRTRNTFNSLFLGSFAVGADCVAGFFPMKFMFETGHRTLPIMKRGEYKGQLTIFHFFKARQKEDLPTRQQDRPLNNWAGQLPARYTPGNIRGRVSTACCPNLLLHLTELC